MKNAYTQRVRLHGYFKRQGEINFHAISRLPFVPKGKAGGKNLSSRTPLKSFMQRSGFLQKKVCCQKRKEKI